MWLWCAVNLTTAMLQFYVGNKAFGYMGLVVAVICANVARMQP